MLMRATIFACLFALAAPASEAAPALVTYGGDVVFGSLFTLEMELGGTTRGTQYDAMNVAGKLTFGGTLGVTLINSFAPAAGNTLNLFDWGTKAGTFSTVNLPALSPGLLWNQSSLYTDGSLSIGLDPAFTGRVWDGGGANNEWATDNNWDLNVEPLNNGTAALVFAGNVRLTPSVDTAWNVASLIFNNTAGAFTVTGPQGVTVGAGGIVNNDADTQTLSAALTLSASQDFIAASGDLSFAGVNLGAHALTVSGAHDIALGAVSGAGTISKTGAGTLNLTGSQNYAVLTTSAGTTNVNGSFTGGTTTVNAHATTNFNASQTLAALNIGAGALVTLGAQPTPFAAGRVIDGGSGNSAVVPEPGILTLLVAGALGLLGFRPVSRRSENKVKLSPEVEPSCFVG